MEVWKKFTLTRLFRAFISNSKARTGKSLEEKREREVQKDSEGSFSEKSSLPPPFSLKVFIGDEFQN